MKRLVVLGGGESGVGTAILGHKKGWKVFLSDAKKIADKYKDILNHYSIEWEENGHTLENILLGDCLMKSPGIPEKTTVMQAVRQKGIKVVSELEFAFQYSKGKIVGITGSNGKTTTTLLTHYLLQQGGMDVALCGNIGYSYALQVANDDKPYYVLEISSFQLDDIQCFAPHIAIITNITPDHLDRYDYSFQKYIDAKFRISENQTSEDYLIYDADDEVIVSQIHKYSIKSRLLPFSLKNKFETGAYIEGRSIIISVNKEKIEIPMEELLLKGNHNVKNTMAASIASQLMRIRKESIRQSLGAFSGVAHRMEQVASRQGVVYINDSKATNVNSVYYALETVNTPIVWIVGGQDKGNDYSSLLALVHQKVKAIVCLGVDNRKIIETFENVVSYLYETQTMEQAVKLAASCAEQGDTVLLSPACASFDLFENYQDRGDQFKHQVEKL